MLRLIILALLPVFAVTASCLADHHETEEGWVALFDGESLEAWKGYQQSAAPKGWVIEDGVLKNESSEVDLVTKQTYGDFELRFEWKISAGGNSGVIYRCDEKEPASYMTGPEYQVLDNQGWEMDSRDPHAAAALYGLYSVSEPAAEPTGQWNTGRIVVRGQSVEHWLNGKQVVSAKLGSEEWEERVSETKFSAWKRFGTLNEGRIALQAHRGKDGEVDPVWYRDIKIRPLSKMQ